MSVVVIKDQKQPYAKPTLTRHKLLRDITVRTSASTN